jgi:hypothetical protein
LKSDRLNLVPGGEVEVKINTIATQRIVAASTVCGRFQSPEIAWILVMLHQQILIESSERHTAMEEKLIECVF